MIGIFVDGYLWRLRKWNIQQYCYGICGMTLVVVGKVEVYTYIDVSYNISNKRTQENYYIKY